MTGNGSALLLTVEETAALLNVSRNTIYSLIREGTIPHVRLGRSIRVPRFGLERWVADQAGIAPPTPQGVELLHTSQQH